MTVNGTHTPLVCIMCAEWDSCELERLAADCTCCSDPLVWGIRAAGCIVGAVTKSVDGCRREGEGEGMSLQMYICQNVLNLFY